MEELVLPTSLTSFSTVQAYGYVGKIFIKSKLTTFYPAWCYGSSLKGSTIYTFVLDINEVATPPATAAEAQRNRHYYYVPDNLLSAYLSADGWSNITSGHVLPISELPSS